MVDLHRVYSVLLESSHQLDALFHRGQFNRGMPGVWTHRSSIESVVHIQELNIPDRLDTLLFSCCMLTPSCS